MKEIYHAQLTNQALSTLFAPGALETIVTANLGQDAWYYQIFHDHFHFDSNAFEQGDSYLRAQREMAQECVFSGDLQTARQAFGRLTHAAQDFYAHSNYVHLWLEAHPGAKPGDINPLDEAILKHSELRSGKIYKPLEALTFFPGLVRFVKPLLPADSHAHMNIDHPGKPLFAWAFTAAFKRTKFEAEQLLNLLSEEQRAIFLGFSA